MNKSTFISKMESINKAYQRVALRQQALLETVQQEFGIDDLSEIPTCAENADNLEEAILCYMQYGEYSPEEIWEELLENAESYNTDKTNGD